jgi:hypothetical protein
MNQEIINLIENSEIALDFIDIETDNLPELIDLINKYSDKYRGYKNGSIGANTELLKIYGNNKLILKPKSDSEYNFIEKDKPNPTLWKFHKILFYKLFEKAVSIRKQLQIQKRKADLKAYLNQQKTCDICQGKYIIKNKARHCRTQKHIKCETA